MTTPSNESAIEKWIRENPDQVLAHRLRFWLEARSETRRKYLCARIGSTKFYLGGRYEVGDRALCLIAEIRKSILGCNMTVGEMICGWREITRGRPRWTQARDQILAERGFHLKGGKIRRRREAKSNTPTL